jgi:xylan 1,4-beta-xylosidase
MEKMGSPKDPSVAQINELKKAGQLKTMSKPGKMNVARGKMEIAIALPRQGVSLVKLDW